VRALAASRPNLRVVGCQKCADRAADDGTAAPDLTLSQLSNNTGIAGGLNLGGGTSLNANQLLQVAQSMGAMVPGLTSPSTTTSQPGGVFGGGFVPNASTPAKSKTLRTIEYAMIAGVVVLVIIALVHRPKHHGKKG